MRWQGQRQSENIEDGRGFRVSRGVGIGGIGGVLLGLAALYFNGDPTLLLQSLQGTEQNVQQTSQSFQETSAEARHRELVSVVLADTEDTWDALFAQMGLQYEHPKLHLFTAAVDSACGFAQSAVGPFYCAADRKVYLDLAFYDELKQRFGAPGEFAQAYVVAHEVGHHVQNLLGISDKVQRARERSNATQANALSVRLELQADCYAGVWAYHANQSRQLLEAGDIESGLNAASAIGDDKLQMQARGYVSPDSFTHGSSEQRVRWFKRGIESGDIKNCDTFKTRSL